MDRERELLLAKWPRSLRSRVVFSVEGPSPCRAGSRRVVLRIGSPEPGDEQEGGWSSPRLLSMDRKFIERVERAIESGRESVAAATATVDPARGLRLAQRQREF
jgi:hypothetical protein